MESRNEMFADYPDIVSPEQLQEILQIGRSKAYSLLKTGEIKSRKVGRNYKIPKVNIIKFLEEV